MGVCRVLVSEFFLQGYLLQDLLQDSFCGILTEGHLNSSGVPSCDPPQHQDSGVRRSRATQLIKVPKTHKNL